MYYPTKNVVCRSLQSLPATHYLNKNDINVNIGNKSCEILETSQNLTIENKIYGETKAANKIK